MVGVLLVLALGVYGFLKIYAKPPDVSQLDQQTAQQGEEDPYADLVAPFIDDGSRARERRLLHLYDLRYGQRRHPDGYHHRGFL